MTSTAAETVVAVAAQSSTEQAHDAAPINSSTTMTTEEAAALLPPNVELSPIPNESNSDPSSSSFTQQNGQAAHVVVDDDDDDDNENISTPVGSVDSTNHEAPAPSASEQRQQYTETLEERVQELEEKLATLSILLQQQQHRPLGPPSPPRSPMADEQETPRVITDDSFMRMMTATTTPSGLLDSPPPQRPSLKKHVRNLSYRVLHTEDFASKTPDRSPPPACSDDEAGLTPHSVGMTISEEELLPTAENSSIFLPETLPRAAHEKSDQDAITAVPTLSLPQTTRSKTDLCHGNIENGSNNNNPPIDEIDKQQSTDLNSRSSPMSALNCSNPSQGSVSSTKKETTPPIRKSSSLTSTGSSREKSTKRPLPKRSNSSMSATAAFTSNGSKFFSSPSPSNNNNNNTKSKWLDYLNSVQESHYDTDKQMEEFVKVPNAVEGLLAFGFWMCVDSFLYTLTILPIRFVWSCLLLIRFAFFRVFRKSSKGGSDSPFRFHRRHTYQLIQMSIIYVVYKYILKPIDISIMYHWIRVQSMVKLYLVIAIVEVFDRLMCSLGQDCLDSLYWNTTRRPRSSRLLVSILVVLTYTAVHSVLLFVHIATMNVAMNSDDQALLSLLIGGNFAEIKSTVFKKYNKASLFKITATDICERFKLALFLVLVLLLNLSQGMDKAMIYKYTEMCGIVWCAEWLSDWVKHAFITKANYIASGVYSEYALLLAGDNSGFGHEGENLDHSHAVVKRLGLAQIPLVCVMAKYLKEAYKYGTYEWQPQIWHIALGIFASWSVLLMCKMVLGSSLHRISRKKLDEAPEFSKINNTTVAKKKN